MTSQEYKVNGSYYFDIDNRFDLRYLEVDYSSIYKINPCNPRIKGA